MIRRFTIPLAVTALVAASGCPAECQVDEDCSGSQFSNAPQMSGWICADNGECVGVPSPSGECGEEELWRGRPLPAECADAGHETPPDAGAPDAGYDAGPLDAGIDAGDAGH
jgi:hypothetical protein